MNRCYRFVSFILLLVCFSHDSMWGQSPIRLGLRAGVDAASARVNSPPPEVSISTTARVGASVGGIIEGNLPGPFSVWVELRYTQKGAVHDFSSVINGVKTTSRITGKIDYFDVPVTLQYKFGKGPIVPFLFAGPTIGVLISANLDLESQGISRTDDVRDQTEPAEVGLDVGGGIELNVFPRASLIADVRYSFGMTNIAKLQDANDPSSWKSRDVKILLGILFDL